MAMAELPTVDRTFKQVKAEYDANTVADAPRRVSPAGVPAGGINSIIAEFGSLAGNGNDDGDDQLTAVTDALAGLEDQVGSVDGAVAELAQDLKAVKETLGVMSSQIASLGDQLRLLVGTQFAGFPPSAEQESYMDDVAFDVSRTSSAAAEPGPIPSARGLLGVIGGEAPYIPALTAPAAGDQPAATAVFDESNVSTVSSAAPRLPQWATNIDLAALEVMDWGYHDE